MHEKITIERLAYGDAGIGHAADGKAVFVNGTCPGDVVEVEVERDRGNYLEARMVELVEASDARVEPACPMAAVCGGCGWQHISYARQLEAKRASVVSQLARTGGAGSERAEALVDACVPSKRTMGYRNKLEFSCRTGERGFELGFHAKGSDDILAVSSCPLAHKQLERTPKALRGALRFMSGADDLGIFRVGVRHSSHTGSLEVALWTTPGAFPRAAVAKTLSQATKTTSIVRVMTADTTSARKLKGLEVLDGRGFWNEEVCGERFGVSAPSFFQVNTEQAEKLVGLVLEGLALPDDGSAVVADLYCGVGTFTLPLARECDTVFAVESYGSSVRDLRHAADRQGFDNIEVIGGDAAREIAELGELDAIVVDPPRAGLAKEAIRGIANARPVRVAYVSCDPATWARDVARLERAGFTLVRATPVDMFPQTYHTEIVSIFRRRRK